MILFVATAVLVATGAADTTVRLPGTGLRLGMPFERVASQLTLEPLPGAQGPGAFRARARFFGLASRASLVFVSDRLTRASFQVDSASEHSRSYVEDELRRQGYRRRCAALEPERRICDWEGPVNVHLEIVAQAILARIEPRPGPSAARPGTPGAPAAAAPPETIGAVGQPDEGSPRVLVPGRPVIPPGARRAGVFGRVLVVALVDTNGTVIDARIERGVAELDEAALACARSYRFEPAMLHGRRARIWTRVPVLFVLP